MRKYLQYFFALWFLLLHALIAAGQQFGGNPSSIKWRQINTDTARIIFPAGLESAGERVATIIHELQKNHTYLGEEDSF